ncbi:MAG: response regulator [Burkholderiales bacterium]|nr:response regulator [Burkholderiales bacterium]
MEINSARILVVDDVAACTAIIMKILKENSFKNVISASNGVDAISLCANSEFDLVLIGPGRSVLNSFETIGTIRDIPIPLFKKIPIIAMIKDEKDSKEEVLFAGATDVILKPIKKEDLVGILKKYLEKEPKED